VPRGLTVHATSRTTSRSKTLRSTRRALAPGNRQASEANDVRETVTDEVIRLDRGNQTPGARTLDMAAR
jgi:hypothetical protein